jgi:xanthine dehydrogenase YagR molybdenum-binding subunit
MTTAPIARSAIGAAVTRIDAQEKVAGQAPYAADYDAPGLAHAVIAQSTISRGRICAIEISSALDVAGVLAVLTYENAVRIPKAPPELAVFQSSQVSYRGQPIAAVIGESTEAAAHGVSALKVRYATDPHDVTLRPNHPAIYRPRLVSPSHEPDSARGDFLDAMSRSPVSIDVTYTTPWLSPHPLEPHATLAAWDELGGLTVHDSLQGVSAARSLLAEIFGLDEERVRVISPYVGGGFGSKGSIRAQAIVAVMAARLSRRPVKAVLTRGQMFDLAGYRSPTVQRVLLGADRTGRLLAVGHDVVEQTSTIHEFTQQTAVPTRMMYASPAQRTTHRLVPLDVPTPSWMRAPGVCPGMYALESAVDELAAALRIDPIELRVNNEPERDPGTGMPFSSRGLVDCLREGANRFQWHRRAITPGAHRDGPWYIGTGVAASTYEAFTAPSRASVFREPDGTFRVTIAAADIGTGARTVLAQIAADALAVAIDRIKLELGDSQFPCAPVAGGSAGTSSWGTAVFVACSELLSSGRQHAEVDTSAHLSPPRFSQHAFGAQFAEVRVHDATGEVRLTRLLGVFAAGTIINPRTAESQLVGGMTMGVGMTLLESGVMDPNLGQIVSRGLSGYYLPTYADVPDVEVMLLPEADHHVNPLGVKGVGEIGIVGTAAAIGNAVWHAIGARFRSLPIRASDIVPVLNAQKANA